MQKNFIIIVILLQLFFILLGCASSLSIKKETIVKPLQKVSAVKAGGEHTCALLLDGSATCWGSNSAGQLGNEAVKNISTIPVAVEGISDIKAIGAGFFQTCTILSDGKVKCVGIDLTRSDLNTIDTKDMPKLFSHPVEMRSISKATAVAIGWAHACVILSDGKVMCWGDNSTGQLGDGTTTNSTTPIKVKDISNASALTTGVAHTCVVLSDGTVKCWGTDSFGGGGKIYGFSSLAPIEIEDISNALSVAAGRNHTCALLSDGTVKCWGSNILGQLGNTKKFFSSLPLQVEGVSSAIAISAGSFHTCTLHSDGTVRCWGACLTGPPKGASVPVSSIPLTVKEISNAVAITCGDAHSCALLSDGTVKCWGANETGQLGGGIRSKFSSTPLTVISCTPTKLCIERRQLPKIIEEMTQAARRDPDNLQLKADLGWVYIRSGNYKDGIPLLMDAPNEPSDKSELLFPAASDSIERRQLYLKTIDAFNSNLDDKKLVLGHIFVSHLSREEIIDQDLILQLKLLANQTQSPLVYDALRELSYGQRDWEHQVQYAEAAIRRINDLGLQVKDSQHLSHFYYNSACGYSLIKDYEKAALRLKEAFSINGSLRSWSLRDPDLENLREQLGIEEFRKLIGVAP